MFVKGLLSDLDRKNTESIAYRFGQDLRALQRFLGEVAWDDKEMRNRLAKQAAKVIGEEDGILAFDPSEFRRALRKREEQYCLAVPSDTNVRDLKNIPEYSGRGTPPKGTFVRVDTLKQSLNDSDWETIDVRDGEKGPLKMKLAVFHVLARTERSGNESEWLIVVERLKGSGVQCDYYLSNAADGTSYDEFAKVVLASHRVEDCFRRAKSECGLADYEVQSWIGWHHHVTLCLLATWFLTKETFRIKKNRHR